MPRPGQAVGARGPLPGAASGHAAHGARRHTQTLSLAATSCPAPGFVLQAALCRGRSRPGSPAVLPAWSCPPQHLPLPLRPAPSALLDWVQGFLRGWAQAGLTASCGHQDLIIFPDDCEFKRVPQCPSGRVYVLKFKAGSKRLFFWMQVLGRAVSCLLP